ncbi:MAG: CoA transferase [SAR202 cluster bacterium]|nr:CoA transferase [SAR202 cluster bacterium]|tara:strand:+ start:1777 stop:2970 length:1194 start_codon:yes stop_codon:yes gene_type:complete
MGKIPKGNSHQLPLEGTRVLEVSEGVAGPYCGRYLASLGAEVVKIERPPLGDWTREVGPFIEGLPPGDNSALNLYNNQGKKSVLLEWTSNNGFENLQSLVPGFDILIEDWDLNLRDDIGVERSRFVDSNPGLIEISVTPFGLSGPYARWKSSPLVQLALGGYMYLTGERGKEPLMLPGRQPDYLTGLNASAAVHIALWERERSGSGQFLEMSMLETLATLHQFTMEMTTFEGVLRMRNGNQWQKESSFASYGITTLPCSDGYICFGISTEDQWERLCAMIGREDLIDDPNYDTRIKRADNSEYLDELLTEWISNRTRREIFVETSEIWGLPTAPILDMSEVVKDEQFIYRNIFHDQVLGKGQTVTFPKYPYIASEMKPRIGMAPRLGEHTEDVLRTK